MIRELAAAVMVDRASENREHDFVRRKSDSQAKPQVAIIGRQDVAAAIEGHRGAGLQSLMTFAAESERNFSLAIELKAAIVELTLQQHVAKHVAQLLIGQTVIVYSRHGCHVSA